MTTQASPIPPPEIRGVCLDAETRCAHYHGPTDVIAIKMKCCDVYYACKDCHLELAGHAIQVWSREEWDSKAVFCGVCRTEMTVWEYLRSSHRCPCCGAGLNPGCKKHHGDYFAVGRVPGYGP